MNQNELENQLRKLPGKAAAAYAARVALRVLPLLAYTKINAMRHQAFCYWPEEKRARNLMSVLRSGNGAMLGALGGGSFGFSFTAPAAYSTSKDLVNDAIAAYGNIDAINAAIKAVASATLDATAKAVFFDADHATSVIYTTLAFSAAFSAAKAAANNTPDFAAPSAGTVDYAAYAAGTYGQHDFSIQAENDLQLLQTKSLSVIDFLQQPLWTLSPPSEWQSLVSRFKSDVISLDAGFEIWLDWYDGYLQGKPIDIKFMEQAFNIPGEVEAQGPQAINDYLSALHNQSANRPLNRVRAIFIGYGDAGKTSLVRVLHNEPVVEGKEPMTPGIDIREWSVPDSDINAHFWDFGGQIMVHATHQLFLRSSCLYVLVISARSEISATEQAEYWLEHVKSFGGSAPVIIVGNRAEQANLNLDMGILKEKYVNIVGYFPLSCTQAQGAYQSHVNAFRDVFCQQLRLLTTHQMMFTNEQFAVLQCLQELTPKQSFLAKAEFEALCEHHQISHDGPQNRAWLLDILDKLGIIIYFPQLPFVDGYVLNPRWLTYGVYTLMYAKQPQLTITEVIRLLSQEKVVDEAKNELFYPADKCRLIMDAMHEFKLSYWLQGQKDTLIIPALLPPSQPVHNFDKAAALAFEFAFDAFFPRQILSELVVNRHHEILEEKVWQTGVILKHLTLQAEALLLADYHARKLYIWITGTNAKEYLTLLRDEVEKILRRINIDYTEWIALPDEALVGDKNSLRDASEKAPFKQLLANADQGIVKYISLSGAIYDVAKVLGYFITATTPANEITNHFHGSNPNVIICKENQMSDKSITIKNSTIQGHVTAADTIENSFNQLNASVIPDDLKQLLSSLLTEIDVLQKSVPSEQQWEIEDMTEDAQVLITELALPQPNQSRLAKKLSGILQTAKTVGEVGNSVLEIASKLNAFF